MDFRLTMIAVLAAMGTACGSSSSSRNNINGTIRGQRFAVADVVSTTGQVRVTGGGTLNLGVAVMTTAGGYCGTIGAAKENRNSQYFNIFLGVTDANGAPTPPSAPGTFTVTTQQFTANANVALANFVALDANCQELAAQTAISQSGTVNLTGVSNEAYSGTFDMMLDSNDHITGSFSAASCPALGAVITNGTLVSCIN